jgi:hypothetical protein
MIASTHIDTGIFDAKSVVGILIFGLIIVVTILKSKWFRGFNGKPRDVKLRDRKLGEVRQVSKSSTHNGDTHDARDFFNDLFDAAQNVGLNSRRIVGPQPTSHDIDEALERAVVAVVEKHAGNNISTSKNTTENLLNCRLHPSDSYDAKYVSEAAKIRSLANNGNSSALRKLGLMYARGEGVLPDIVITYSLFGFSAMQHPPDHETAYDFNEIKCDMTNRQIFSGNILIKDMQRLGVLAALDAWEKSD